MRSLTSRRCAYAPASTVSLFCSLSFALLLFSTILQPCHAATDVHAPAPAPAIVSRSEKDDLPQGPVSVEPDQFWGGIDGSWSTFGIRVGNPPQFLRALVSTASQQTWAIHSTACIVNETDPKTQKEVETTDDACYEGRGYTFNITQSESWDERGFYQLWTEKNLGLVGNGQYGFDEVGTGFPGEDGPTVKNSTVGTLVTENFWLGHIGVNPKPTNFSAFTDPAASYMTSLFKQKAIPSVSFGYTAGSKYHLAEVLGSLTLGGYDASRFIPNDLTFLFAPDNERDIVVGVTDITVNSATKSNVNIMVQDQFTMYIDSTVAEIWLPPKICDAFEESFGLKFDNDTKLYLVDDLLHQTLLADNPNVTFSLGQKSMSNATVDITLPYAAFDLTASPPFRGLTQAQKYFPIRRAQKENQFVFGRTFLQEAYLIVDWERQNFSISQCNWVFGENKQIVPIISPSYPQDMFGAPIADPKPGLSNNAIIGIAVGGGFALALVLCGVLWFFWRRRQKRRLAEVKAQYAAAQAEAVSKPRPSEKQDEDPSSPTDKEEGSNVFPKAELPAEFIRPELAGDEKRDPDAASPSSIPAAEVANTERQIFEMEGDIPTTQEAGGRQLSEKETMMVRERIYNGTDPNSPTAVSPVVDEAPHRPPPLSADDIALVNAHRRRMPPPSISPTSPRTPLDGVLLDANDTFFQPPSARAPRDGRFMEAEDTLLSPISPLEGSTDTSRRRFSYEAP
ncbi:acid protease [Aaosphaeria arxii CBS 175.79]|uniref:Acid protease n=1 Tax=Aaosphaeria arxii CBS 175.79 TaxID=1450172 RepID=A0A6A5Y540_9PLEO|nr:acid protease [Aaosphaeria arxii CBS 175.79]KAF2020157.1 acid protease [Aaosphaeria arxii CBS 175.79]